MSTTTSGVIVDRLFVALGTPAGRLAAERGDFAFEVANASLPRVAADDRVQGFVGEGDVLRRQPVVLHLLVQQVLRAILSFSSSV